MLSNAGSAWAAPDTTKAKGTALGMSCCACQLPTQHTYKLSIRFSLVVLLGCSKPTQVYHGPAVPSQAGTCHQRHCYTAVCVFTVIG
jgi:hypothetical protein